MSKPYKVLGVGLQKSGTSTLRECLIRLGYRVDRQHKDVFADARRGRFESTLARLEAHEAFTGLAPSYLFPLAFDRYGERMRAVLTLRASPEAWLASLTKHMRRRTVAGNLINLRVYGLLYPQGRERAFMDHYERHADWVRDFFARRGAEHQLLELCWEKGDGWEKLCGFLGEPVPADPIPHSNRTEDLAEKPIREALNRRLMAAYARLVPPRPALRPDEVAPLTERAAAPG